MDGDQESPTGKTAENWSRRDGIRAGSVSGPWRSAPRASEPAEAATGVDRVPPPRTPPAVRRRRRLPAAVWLGFGTVIAAGCVLAAVLLRPDHQLDRTDTTVAPVAAPAPDVAPPAPDDAALASVGHVRLRVPAGLAEERRQAIVATLRTGGIADVQVEALTFAVETSRVGYYREPDRAAAEALGRLLAPLVTPGGELPVRDYAKLLDDPQPGRLDLWVSE